MKPLALLIAAMSLLSVAPASVRAQHDARFEAMQARAIGPAGMSGRVSDVEVVLSDRSVIYVGAATGGVFRSDDGGITWDPIFDDQPAIGIGHIAVFQPNPDIVWVGTGEGNPRNSAGVGGGLFKSIDGGESWSFMGFGDSERIHRVLTHPTDPDVVYVGVLGPAWSDGTERGVYRTTDGGDTWEQVLWQNERTGVADMVMDPSNPDKIFAAMWDFRREPWFLTSGGPGSGLFVTHDGGETWTRLTEEHGMPAGELGRIGVAVASSDTNVVYALVEAERSELLRSEDGGLTWETISNEPGINPRPFYYADLRVDPHNENRLYRLHSAIQVSEDQGRTWETVVPSAIIHGDIHELWIDPDDPDRMILGEDGGIAFTYDRGDRWRFVENLPLAQFYHIALDDAVPFNIYGGLQDNGSWFGPSTVWENKGILNAHWFRVGGGDGFSVMPDRSNPDRYGYSQSQGGNLQHFDKLTGFRRSIRPVHPDGVQLRFNWNAALMHDPHDVGTIYSGSQFVHRSSDQGRTWEIISPDLTTNDESKQGAYVSGGLTYDASGAEMHTTIISIQPSPLERGVIWVGTDDGNVQITRDGGGSWANVRDNVPGLPDGIWIPDVQPSRHVAGRAYLVAEDHRRGDWTPFVWVTEDYGESWRSIAGDGIDSFVHAIEEDPDVPELLFLGTEHGLRMSLDRGGSWSAFTAGVPAVPIRDLLVHPRDGDLVLGTHGRALLVVDDIGPLRELSTTSGIRNAVVHAFTPPPAMRVNIAEAIGYRSTGHAMQQGETRPHGALLSFWVHEDGRTRLEVSDRSGAVVWSDEIDAVAGMNRTVWNLRPGGDAADSMPRQIMVAPGSYTFSVERDAERAVATLEVHPDPRNPISAAQHAAKVAALQDMQGITASVNEAREGLEEALDGVSMVLETLGEPDSGLREQGEVVRALLVEVLQRHFTGPECQGNCRGILLSQRVGAPMARIAGEDGAPSPNTRIMMDQARQAAETILDDIRAVMDADVAAFRTALRAAGYTPFGG
ncbi:MAG: WD40/YVTN/BNR-like repeat-containing protein [Longimicrobiales bacterium]